MELKKSFITQAEYNVLKRRLCLSKQKVKDFLKLRNTFGDVVKVTDEVLVYEGAGADKKLKFASKGHIVNQGLINLINHFVVDRTASVRYFPSRSFASDTTYAYMLVGTGTDVTQGTTTDLTTADSTKADSQAGASSNPAGGSYRVTWTATWNAGTLGAISVAELGLFLHLNATLRAFGYTDWTVTGTALFSRLSDADGDFTTFVVNTSVPLTVEWRLTVAFA